MNAQKKNPLALGSWIREQQKCLEERSGHKLFTRRVQGFDFKKHFCVWQ